MTSNAVRAQTILDAVTAHHQAEQKAAEDETTQLESARRIAVALENRLAEVRRLLARDFPHATRSPACGCEICDVLALLDAELTVDA